MNTTLLMKQFNIRVYGLCVEEGKILLSDEIRFGIKMTKFPGGGLEFGEGLETGLKREWMEEMKAPIEVGEILYTNPFLQISAFNSNDEIIAMYFRVKRNGPIQGRTSEQVRDFEEIPGDQQVFRWVPIRDLTQEDLTFPIDQSLISHFPRLFPEHF